MKELYQWLQDLAVYLILVSAILQALPQESYQKYIRFFSGLVLIILLMTPLLRLTDMEDSFRSRVQEQNMEQESASFLEEIREKQEEGKGEMTLETEEKEQIEAGLDGILADVKINGSSGFPDLEKKENCRQNSSF